MINIALSFLIAYFTFSGLNDNGSKSFNVTVLKLSSVSPKRISKSSSQNSLKTCLQTPQGAKMPLITPLFPPTTAIFENSFSPSEMALKTATLSAQTVGPKAAFSIFVPVKTLPFLQRSAAPTFQSE